MAALNLLVLLCTGISELDLGVSSLGGNVAQSQLWKGALPACPHTFQAAKITGLFSMFFNCYCSHLMVQLFFLLSPTEGRSAICTGEHTERHEDGFFNDDTTRKEKYPVLRHVSCRSLCKTTMEDSNPKISQTSLIPQADEDSPLNMLNESVAANMLQELGEKLQLLARYETGFPQGLVNVLTCTWREITEGVDHRKWHQKSLPYKSVRSRRSQASEEVKSGALGSRHTECEITAIRKEPHKKSFALPAYTTKGKRKPETASNMPLGSKGNVMLCKCAVL